MTEVGRNVQNGLQGNEFDLRSFSASFVKFKF